MENKQEIHVLMVAFSSQGHINPMLRLGKRLISKGLHVTLATTEIARHRMLSSSTTTTAAVTANSIAGIRLEFFSDGLTLDYDRKSNIDYYMNTLGRVGPTNLSSIIHHHCQSNSGPKFSCVVSNPFVPWVADVATEHGIPCAMLWIQPCTLYSVYYRFYNNLNKFPTLNNPEMSVELPGLPLLNTQALPSFVLPTNAFNTFPKLFSNLFKNMKKHKWVLVNSFLELEKEVIDSIVESEITPVWPIGPLVPPEILGEDETADAGVEMWKSEDSCIDWLDKQEPCSVIYVSFGSIIVLSENQTKNIAIALKKTRRPFLWVVKLPDYQSVDGKKEVSLEIFEELKEQGLIVHWSPQIKVLKHPSIGCFLSHCGWNSMLETISAGVPVIAYPQWTDQPTNAKLVADVWRIGVRVEQDGGEVSSEEVERCIEEIMCGLDSAEFRKNAAALKVAAREAVADGGSSERNIQLFVDDVIRNCKSA